MAHGAMGNARWTGVKLKDVLAKAGVGAGAVQVIFSGMDQGGEDKIPDFIKSLNVDIATRNGDIIFAYAMNGTDLPMRNGYPVRLIVPGYTGTYWVKHLTQIAVVNAVFTGFYMRYRFAADHGASGMAESCGQHGRQVRRGAD